MAIPKFEADLNIISKLSDYPGSEDGLTPDGFRKRFDLAGNLIQEYINTILIPNINMTSDVDALVAGVEKQLTTVFTNNMANFFESVVRSGDYVLNRGYKFSLTKTSDTLFRMYGGEAVIQGHFAPLNMQEPINIPVVYGTYGTSRKDLICLRFERTSDNTESLSIVYLQGQITQGESTDPEYRKGNINVLGAAVRDLPLYRIRVQDTTATAEALFTPFENIANAIAEDVANEAVDRAAELAAEKVIEEAVDRAAELAAKKVIEDLSVWEGGSY